MHMKTNSKIVLGCAMLLGAAIGIAAPAEARVGVSVNLGVFAPPPPPAPAYALPGYCYDAYYYANCGYQVWGEPVFWNGYWYPNPRYRFIRGRREFWVSGGWHEARIREHERRR
jgi:hypothetical protein